MATLNALGKQMRAVESQLADYDANLPSAIQGEIQRAATPILQRTLGETTQQMSDFVPTLMGAFNDYGMGTTAYDLSPAQKLAKLGGVAGSLVGNINQSQQLSDYMGGQMSDMYEKALRAAQLGQQNLADKYARLSDQYNTALQIIEAEKDRQLQRELTRGRGGGGMTINWPETKDVKTGIPSGYKTLISQMEQRLKQIPRRGQGNVSASQRKAAADSIVKLYTRAYPSLFDYIDMYSVYNMADFSDRANPALK